MIVDGHLDIALNAMEWNRDYTQSVEQIRDREIALALTDKRDRGKGTVSLPNLRKANVGLVFATQIGRFVSKDSRLDGWHSPAQAWAMTQAQRAWYEAMCDLGEMTQITDSISLQNHITNWNNNDDTKKPIGYVLTLEGADSLINLNYLEKAYEYGLRAIGPAHYGPGRYAAGTGMTEGFTKMGFGLLKEMGRLNMILDVTHLTDNGFDEALECFNGHIWASHHNCRSLVPHQRQLSDEQIKRLIERGAVIGGALDAWMLAPNFIQRQSKPSDFGVKLESLIDHWDNICQIAGNSHHIALGTDLDGMFGTEQSPTDLNSVSDIAHYQTLLENRGYSAQDIDNIFSGNWLRILKIVWK